VLQKRAWELHESGQLAALWQRLQHEDVSLPLVRLQALSFSLVMIWNSPNQTKRHTAQLKHGQVWSFERPQLDI
jgi:hypothetical protein